MGHDSLALRAALLDDPRQALFHRLRLIRNAQTQIEMGVYLWAGDHVGLWQLAELREAVRRGVRVRILLDGWGARLPRSLLEYLVSVGIEVRVYHPRPIRISQLDHRLHDKFLIVDERQMVLGGRNASDAYYRLAPSKRKINFEDLEIYLELPDSTQTQTYFDTVWQGSGVVPFSISKKFSLKKHQEQERLLDSYRAKDLEAYQWAIRSMYLTSGFVQGQDSHSRIENYLDHRGYEVLTNKIREGGEATLLGERPGVGKTPVLTPELVQFIDRAKKSLVLMSPYASPDWKVHEALVRAVKRGVSVSILSNSMRSTEIYATAVAARQYYRVAREAGIRIFESPGPDTVHSKAWIRDLGEEVFVGSYNLDERASRLNTENGVILRGNSACQDLSRYAEMILKHSHEVIDPKKDILKSGWIQECTANFMGPLIPWIRHKI